MRKLRWRIRFKTIKNRDAAVYIYKEGYTGSNVDEIEGAEDVITTDEDSTDELLSPIRHQTGYLRVIDNGDLEGLMPTDNMQHYVELMIDGRVEWCGYMQADTFSEEWSVPPVVTEFPLISGLGVLEGCYLDQTKPMRNIWLHELMRECLDMAKIDYRDVYVPKECELPGYGAFVLSMLGVSRANFFTPNDTENENGYMRYDAMTAKDVLAEVCKFMGWTIQEHQKDIYIVSHGNDCQYGRMAYSAFGKEYKHGEMTDRVMVDMESLGWDGDSHTRDVLQGKKKMKVKANTNPMDKTVIDVNANNMKKLKIVDVSHGMKVTEHIKLYDGGGQHKDYEMYQYTLRKNSETDIDAVPTTYNADECVKRMGGYYCDHDIFYNPGTGEEEKKRYTYKHRLVMNFTYGEGKEQILYAGKDAKSKPLMKLRNRRCVSIRDGALVLNLTQHVRWADKHYSEKKDTNQACSMCLSLRVGDKYWTGMSWDARTDAAIFLVDIDDNSKIIDTKDLSMPYNDAEGYIMPIKEPLSGDVELVVYSPDMWELPLVTWASIEGLTISYFESEENEDKKKDSNNYETSVDAAYRENVNVNLMLASYNNNPAGYGLLNSLDGNVEELQYIKGGRMRPERYLLSKLKRIYGRNIEKLTMGVEATGMRPMDGVAYGNKRYDIAYRKTDWENEHEELTIMDVV